MTKLSGGHLAAKALKAEGVKYVFTLCEFGLAPFYEGCETEGIQIISFRSEQGAATAADGWSRITGKPGVAMFASGPSFTNAYTGIANAYLCQSPVVYIGRGRSNPAAFDLGDLHEIDRDYIDLLRPITKWSRICHRTERIPEYLGMAFRHALAGRPGPAYLETPISVAFGRSEESTVPFPTNYRTESRVYGDPDYVQQAAELMLKAHKPVVMAGGGVYWSQASEALQEFVNAVNAPVFQNGLGRGCVPPDHPMAFSYPRRQAFREADVILLIGTELDFRLNYGRPPSLSADAKIIHVNIDPTEIGRNRGADIGITGDPKAVLTQLITAVDGRKRSDSDWLDCLREAQAEGVSKDEMWMRSETVPMHPLRVIGELRHFLSPEDIVIGDGGFFVNFAARVLKVYKPGHWLDPGLMGCLGVGPGFAIAAKLAHPESRVVLLSGDGAFGFNGMELETMSRYGINVVTIVGNNGSWGMEKHIDVWTDQAIAAELSSGTRYDIIAQGMGCHGELVERPEQIRPALERAFAAGKPALLNVVLNDETSIYRATGSGVFKGSQVKADR
ncbi:acetolactate synthase [Desulfosarcina ovata subsp. sediminis]|uniref:Acetolactate synthase n=1 Tax=Desulfosarcina ovata subsp. sediminis TaxID=885957 RepID=A0A5K7ZIJ6_9BACT|nr:thiamine pyrophosphate-dependent enzyme [Desulfosarcina ovata]BBO82048.1 acetolactate synthase [Desulfosarcina ovata subsp. sediminis]